jgi:hypothetical protein
LRDSYDATIMPTPRRQGSHPDCRYLPIQIAALHSTGQALVGLSEDIRRVVREEARRDLGDTGGPVKPEAEYRIASGERQGT